MASAGAGRVHHRLSRAVPQNAHDDEWTRTLEFTRLDVAAIEEKIHGVISEIRAVSYGLKPQWGF